MKIADLGAGTYSRLAAEEFAKKMGDLLHVSKPTFQSVADSVRNEGIDFAVLPCFNDDSGVVHGTLDLLHNHDLKIIDMVTMPVIIAVGKYPGSNGRDCIYSHPKALEQCMGYLERNYPGSRHVHVASTEEGIETVRSMRSGIALGRKDIIEGSLELIAEDVSDRKGNQTAFFIVTDDYAWYRICRDC